MMYRTVVPATYDEHLATEYPETSASVVAARAADLQTRQTRLTSFPYSVVLKVAYPELDYANRWCWQQFGPGNGDCLQASAEYPACELGTPHSHEGRWLSYWLVKTEYDYGFNEWCFVHSDDRDRFLKFVPQINWGENYPK